MPTVKTKSWASTLETHRSSSVNGRMTSSKPLPAHPSPFLTYHLLIIFVGRFFVSLTYFESNL
jgi:hypothetical protein